MKAPRGQNFLYQQEWQRRIAAELGRSRRLVEIGGGPGGLSAFLAEASERLWVVENDPVLAAGLRERLAGPTVEIIEADVLGLDLTALAAGETLRVAGNLPYYITSPILLHLFRHAPAIEDAHLMVQREVAERMLAKPGGRQFGLLSATTQFYADPEHVFDVPPGAFRPRPSVYSSLVRLKFRPQAEALGVDPEGFIRFLRTAFAQKRKQLGKRFGIRMTARAEQLSLAELAGLYRQLRAQEMRG